MQYCNNSLWGGWGEALQYCNNSLWGGWDDALQYCNNSLLWGGWGEALQYCQQLLLEHTGGIFFSVFVRIMKGVFSYMGHIVLATVQTYKNKVFKLLIKATM